MNDKKKVKGNREEGALLLAVAALRTSPTYFQAEVDRRARGSAAMAGSGPDSKDYASVRLLIGTWESIASNVRAGGLSEDRVFETQPVLYMWNELEEAIKIIRADIGDQYASDFEWLKRGFEEWVRDKPPFYRTQAGVGVQALFG